MVEFIRTIIERFGGRPAGTEAEHQAQLYAIEVLEGFCDEVEHHQFTSALKAKFHALKGFCIIYVIAIVLFPFNTYLAACVAMVNAILFVGHFLTYGNWMDFLYKKHQSSNVIGKIEPEGEMRSTVIVAGHMDSVIEFQWWYKLGNLGGVLTTISGFLLVTQGLAYLLAAGFQLATHELPILFTVFWWMHIVLSPILITFYSMHGTEPVDGALDNLSGVALAVEMGKVYSGPKRLKHTRLKVISFGSEETGLRGANNYVRSHLEELKAEGAVIFNIDTIKSEENLSVVKRELNTMVKYDEDMVSRASAAFETSNVPYLKINMPVGGTDGAAFARQGIPAVSIIGLTVKRFDPTYHTRLDNLSNLDPKGLEAMKKVTMAFIDQWDADQ